MQSEKDQNLQNKEFFFCLSYICDVKVINRYESYNQKKICDQFLQKVKDRGEWKLLLEKGDQISCSKRCFHYKAPLFALCNLILMGFMMENYF